MATGTVAGLAAACSDGLDTAATSTTSEASGDGSSGTEVAPSDLGAAGLPDRPDPPLRVVLDSDTANEIDDQFALAQALLAPELLSIEAITAAPFSFGEYLARLYDAQAARGGEPVTPYEELAVSMGTEQIDALRENSSAAVGMESSLIEINRVLDAAAPAVRPPAIPGSERFMSSEDEPVESEAATAIIEAANSGDGPLYVAVLGAATNVASALLLDPSIADKMAVLFVAGFPSASKQVDESFNLLGDPVASRVLFSKADQLLYIPGYQVAEVLTMSMAEADAYLRGRGPLGDLLWQLMQDKLRPEGVDSPGGRRVMWDMAPIAWLIDPRWVGTFETPRGTITEDHTWEPTPGEMTEAYRIDDVAVFSDFFGRVEANSQR